MSQVRIKTAGKHQLRKASRDAVGAYFANLSNRDKRERWLAKRNRYRVDCTQKYQRDLAATPSTVDHRAMVAYIAASGPGHVIDGWSLLGRAVESALRSDSYAAIHLGYYAELRAAMALLASEGIGILNTRHPTIDRSGQTSTLPPQVERWNKSKSKYEPTLAGTHTVVWPCLQHWATLGRAFDLLDEIFRPANISLSDWIAKLGGKVSSRAIAANWFQSWGLDLSILDDDHESRNLASYRPSEFRLPPAVPPDDVMDYLNDLWFCFEPSGGGRFLSLEKQLLRRALLAADVATPIPAGSLPPLGITAPEVGPWLAALNNPVVPRIFLRAEERGKVEDAVCHLQVMSRAVLLLAVATSAVRRHLFAAGYTPQHLQFWWRRYGLSRGLWDADTDPDDSTNLWADVRDGLLEIQQWRDRHGAGFSVQRFTTDNALHLRLLGALELSAIWGLAT
jgi:hypothetical protein